MSETKTQNIKFNFPDSNDLYILSVSMALAVFSAASSSHFLVIDYFQKFPCCFFKVRSKDIAMAV